MSARTMIIRVLMATQPRNMQRFAGRVGLGPARIYRVLADNCGHANAGLTLKTLQRITEGTGIAIGKLAEWWAEDEATVPAAVLEFRMPWHRNKTKEAPCAN